MEISSNHVTNGIIVGPASPTSIVFGLDDIFMKIEDPFYDVPPVWEIQTPSGVGTFV